MAAGLGTRLLPITENIPKCLVEINNKKLIDYWLETLHANKIENVLINTHYKSELVLQHIEKWSNKLNITVSHEDELLGTAGTLIGASEYIGNSSVMVIHADNLSYFNMDNFIKTFAEKKEHCRITMMTFRTDNPRECGIIEVDKDGLIIDYLEKTEKYKSNLANGAVYIFDSKAISEILEIKPTPFDLSAEVIPKFIGRMNAFHNSQYHRDIGTVNSLKFAEIEYVNFINQIQNK